MEAFILTDTMCKSLEEFEIWAYFRILRVSSINRVTTEAVLQLLYKERDVIITIKRNEVL